MLQEWNENESDLKTESGEKVKFKESLRVSNRFVNIQELLQRACEQLTAKSCRNISEPFMDQTTKTQLSSGPHKNNF